MSSICRVWNQSCPSPRWACLKRLSEPHLPRFEIKVFLLLGTVGPRHLLYPVLPSCATSPGRSPIRHLGTHVAAIVPRHVSLSSHQPSLPKKYRQRPKKTATHTLTCKITLPDSPHPVIISKNHGFWALYLAKQNEFHFFRLINTKIHFRLLASAWEIYLLPEK